MTAIKHALQRDIFTPNDERLLSIVNVCKAGKKKKNCFLCATGRTETQSDPTYPCQITSVNVYLMIILPLSILLIILSDHRASSAGEGGESEEVR